MRNLHNFIKELEKQNDLIRIKTFVDPVLEIAEITDRISKQPLGGKAILFENTGTDFPVLMNSLGSEKRICLALGVDNLDEIGQRINKLFTKISSPKINLLEKLKMLPALGEISSWLPVHKSGKGICQEIIHNNPDLQILPILKCWPLDGGRFITFPLVHTKDPESGIRNTGMYRMQVFSRDTTGMHWHMHKTGARHYNVYKKLGLRMPIAVALGGDPIYTYAATAPLPDNIDEYIFAGFLRGKKVEMVKAITQDIEVPSDADIVIEGYVDPQEELAWEGPFGDHTGYYSLADWYPKFHVTCITHKKNAIYPATLVGIPPQEDAYIAKATERIFLAPIRLAMAPEILDMNLPVEGVAHNLAIVKIDKSFPGQGFKVMNALWGAGQMMFNKVMVVTGSETDIFNPTEVLKACVLNVKRKNHITIQAGPADILDHALDAFAYGGKICVDATLKTISEGISNKTTVKIDISAVQQSANVIKDRFNFIKKINIDLYFKGLSTIIYGIEKHNHSEIELLKNLISEDEILKDQLLHIIIDSDMPIENISYVTWLSLGNIDPLRDISIVETNDYVTIYVDATAKSKEKDGFQREWPLIITSEKATIERIDEIWESLNIGPLIPSPSLGFIK